MPINAKPCPNCGARYFPEDKVCPSCGLTIGQVAPEIMRHIPASSTPVPFFIKVLRVFGGVNLAIGLLIGLIILLAFSKSGGLGLILLLAGFAIISECLIVFALFYALASMSENLIAIRELMEEDRYEDEHDANVGAG
jgi:hypothetical protein